MATVIATETFRSPAQRGMVHKGDPADADSPAVKHNPAAFVTPEEYQRRTNKPTTTAELGDRSMSARTVEQATAAPGEVRDVGHPCPQDDCDVSAKSRAGLKAHLRSHA